MRRVTKRLTVLMLLLMIQQGWAAPEKASPRDRGEGPFDRLILRGVIVVDGEGAPPVGPMDVVIEGNRIAAIENVGYPDVPIEESKRPAAGEGDRVMD